MHITSKLIPFGASVGIGTLTDVFFKGNDWSSSLFSAAAYNVGVEGSTFCFKTFGLEGKKYRVLAHGITAALMVGTGTASYDLIAIRAITDLAHHFFYQLEKKSSLQVEKKNSLQELAEDTVSDLYSFFTFQLDDKNIYTGRSPKIHRYEKFSDPSLTTRIKTFISNNNLSHMTPEDLLRNTNLLEELQFGTDAYTINSKTFEFYDLYVSWILAFISNGDNVNLLHQTLEENKSMFFKQLDYCFYCLNLPPSTSALFKIPNLFKDYLILGKLEEDFKTFIEAVKEAHIKKLHSFHETSFEKFFKGFPISLNTYEENIIQSDDTYLKAFFEKADNLLSVEESEVEKKFFKESLTDLNTYINYTDFEEADNLLSVEESEVEKKFFKESLTDLLNTHKEDIIQLDNPDLNELLEEAEIFCMTLEEIQERYSPA